jgi:hypothetical protein
MNNSKELYNYLYHQRQCYVKQRAYDKKYEVVRPTVEIHIDNSHTLGWETVGVFTSNINALEYLNKALKERGAFKVEGCYN